MQFLSNLSEIFYRYRQDYSTIYMEDKETKIVENNFEERKYIGTNYLTYFSSYSIPREQDHAVLVE